MSYGRSAVPPDTSGLRSGAKALKIKPPETATSDDGRRFVSIRVGQVIKGNFHAPCTRLGYLRLAARVALGTHPCHGAAPSGGRVEAQIKAAVARVLGRAGIGGTKNSIDLKELATGRASLEIRS